MHPDSHTRFGAGLGLALASALAFGMSGTLATGLLAAGWSPVGIVIPRVSIGAASMLIPALWVLRGRWGLLRSNWRMVVGYGLVAIALPQLGQFSAVQYMQVGQALLIQYLAPLLIVVLLWVRRGERPSGRTVLGCVLALVGLLLALQVTGAGLSLDPRGLLWATMGLVGNAAYFIISSDDRSDLPPLALAFGGTLVGAIALGLLALLGVLPFQTATAVVTYAGVAVAWWAPLVVLGIVSSALSYVTGIFAARMLGTRLSSFVGLSEVLFAIVLAALLMGQYFTVGQTVGGVLVMAGVVLVKLGEQHTGRPAPASGVREGGERQNGEPEKVVGLKWG